MMPRTPVPALLLTAALAVADPASAQSRPRDPFAGFDAYATDVMKTWKVPGMAIAVVRGDSLLWAKGYGVRSIGDTARVDARTMFAIGSASKAFTGAALSMLVDEKKVSYDAHVTDYLPWFQLYDPYATREMRVRDLLIHDSGLSRGEALWYGTTRSREEVVRGVRNLPPSASFRAKFQYQNIMYITAGEIIHAVTGKEWDDVITARIFEPLGMRASNTTVRALTGQPNVASPHADLGKGVQVIPWRNIDNAAPAGSINSNALDMARWVQLWLGKGTFRGNRLLSPAIAEESITEQMVVNDPEFHVRLNRPKFLGYGYGWFVTEHRGHRFISHGGNIDGMAALVSFLPDDGVGVVILTNLNQSDMTIPLTQHLFDRLLGVPAKDYSPAYKAMEDSANAQGVAGRQARVEGTKPSLALAEYVGTYVHPLLGTATVALDPSGALTVAYDVHPTVRGPLTHYQYDTFMATTSDAIMRTLPVTFHLGTNGKVRSMHFAVGGDDEWVRK